MVVPLAAALVAPAASPAAGANPVTQVLDVSVGPSSTCAVLADGTLRCWGWDWDNDEPVPAPPEGTFVSVSSGANFWCALRDDATVTCWGNNDSNQASPPGDTFTAIDAGWNHACGLRPDGTIACWGNNGYGKRIPEPGTYTSVSAGWLHTCAVRASDQAVVCWGSDEEGESEPLEGTYTDVSAGTNLHTCAIRTDGTVACWGYNEYNKSRPPSGTFSAISAGETHTCGIQTDGTLACWGGDEDQAYPPAGTYLSVSAGMYHSCAISTDHTLACWGSDWLGTPRPEIAFSPISRWRLTSEIALSWAGTPGLADVASYDVRYRQARWNAGFGEWQNLRSGTADTEATFTGARGYTYCFQVRARDLDGYVSYWNEQCTSIPLDDRALTRAGGWTAKIGTAYYAGTALRTTKHGATLTRTQVRFKRLAIVATTCPTCGSVKVYLGTRLLKSIDLQSATTVHQKVIAVKRSWSTEKGTIKIVVSSRGKPVLIDGLAVYRD